MLHQTSTIKRRQLPKLYACMTKQSLENLRNKYLFNLDVLDANGIRRIQQPLHECLIIELKESGYLESANYLQDLIYDNVQLVNEDDLGIVVDLRKRHDYLQHMSQMLQKAERHHDRGDLKKETLSLLSLAQYFTQKEKGIMWLAEKLYLAAIAVSSQYLIDGGRQKSCCKYHYAKFLLDKFPGLDDEEPFHILTEVRDASIGKDWSILENDEDGLNETVFCATAIQLHRVLMSKARKLRATDTPKAERLARLAERRAKDAMETDKEAEAIIEIGICQLMMNNLNNAHKTFDRALKIHTKSNNIEGICESKMHLAAVMQRLGEHETAARLLTEMGLLAMDNGLRRQLGRALHLLGELHLRREKPELGTQHLAEAFLCFMGSSFIMPQQREAISDSLFDTKELEKKMSHLSTIYRADKNEMYEEEAEQSRLMTAISAGQELMASYFNLLREAGTCSVAQVKTMEWKLGNHGWWVTKRHHNLLSCICPMHNRTPLDVLQLQLASANTETETDVGLTRQSTIENLKKLHSSFIASLAKL